jgi:hypothetical protein
MGPPASGTAHTRDGEGWDRGWPDPETHGTRYVMFFNVPNGKSNLTEKHVRVCFVHEAP